MHAYILDWLGLVVRWFHVTAGIAWIGASFFFVWLDDNLNRAVNDAEKRRGIDGELWSVHGGGFYHNEKYLTGPVGEPLSNHLHWFYWEAYSTWLSGMAMLAIVYWAGASTFMIDKSVMDLTPAAAIGISIASLVAGWFIYDALCRIFERNEFALWTSLGIFLLLFDWGFFHVFGARAAFLHVGAVIGTIMVWNVFFIIIPGQRKVVRQLRAGEVPDTRPGFLGKQRSVQNTYFHAARAVHHDQPPLSDDLQRSVRLARPCGLIDRRRLGAPLLRAHALPQSRLRAADRRDPLARNHRLGDRPAGAAGLDGFRPRGDVRAGGADRGAALRRVPLRPPVAGRIQRAACGRVARHARTFRGERRGDPGAGGRLARDAARQPDEHDRCRTDNPRYLDRLRCERPLMLTTHVLDTSTGQPAAKISVMLFALDRKSVRTHVATAVTNLDGRTKNPLAERLSQGIYELIFSVAPYFAAKNVPAFYDEITIRFRVDDARRKYHVPLLLAPWGYSTYRGS